ncbi:integrase domain-containing protein [Paracidovorax anthurii]|uniref:Integrase-like protein n=1 Tax=Paracidovorax anthurii TaxID=78229 RepID=A0A328Z4P6_9BURK|nr:integrase domain-containing protein [Paracidovorax anthurii]RAR81028.1 integrase-like protein [Paracidovorax anthurii]
MDPPRPQAWAGKSPQDILARLPPGRADPMHVLDTLIGLFNTRHTAREKTVSHKTRHERARFLRRFFLDLKGKAGFRTVPDPRNLGQKHLHAMVQVWQREQLAPATIQTYLSFLRGLASWMNKPGFVRPPERYGLSLEEYQRHEAAQHDKSWSAHGIDVEDVLAQVAQYDARIAASMRLAKVLALRRKESVMFRPFEHVVAFEQTGLPAEQRKADEYVWTKGKGGRVRWVAIETDAQRDAVALARSLATSRDAHMGDPALSLKRNLRRLDYAFEKFGITKRLAGTTGHGLRHGNVNDLYEDITGVPSPVRGGGPVAPELDRAARLAVAARAGHSRMRASTAYIGAISSPSANQSQVA